MKYRRPVVQHDLLKIMSNPVNYDSPIVNSFLEALRLNDLQFLTNVTIDIKAGKFVMLKLEKMVTPEELKKVISVIEEEHLEVIDDNRVVTALQLASNEDACIEDLALLVNMSRVKNLNKKAPDKGSSSEVLIA